MNATCHGMKRDTRPAIITKETITPRELETSVVSFLRTCQDISAKAEGDHTSEQKGTFFQTRRGTVEE